MNNRLHSIGVSMELTGNRNAALEYYRKARTDFKEENEWEKFWLRKLRLREANPISKTDSLLIAADNNRSVGKLTEALAVYNSMITTKDPSYNDDVKAQINHGLGQTYYKQKDYNKAIEQFKANLSLNPAEEKYLVPEACFQIGRCYLRLGNRTEAQKYFDKIDEYDYDYDFKDSMDGKVKNEISKK
jgi:tetratricopeptide (TPR) repeat protein